MTVSLMAATAAPTFSSARPPVDGIGADSVAGEWMAKGADPGWNGRFVLHLSLAQVGDSVYGTYQFELDNAAVMPPSDIFGHIRSAKLELEDRSAKFWLGATLRGDHLDGRLAGGGHDRVNAIPVSFARVGDHGGGER